MEEIKKAIQLAYKAFYEKYGADAKIEDGDEIMCVMNNCTLIISLHDGNLKHEFIKGKPLIVDYSLGIFEQEG